MSIAYSIKITGSQAIHNAFSLEYPEYGIPIIWAESTTFNVPCGPAFWDGPPLALAEFWADMSAEWPKLTFEITWAAFGPDVPPELESATVARGQWRVTESTTDSDTCWAILQEILMMGLSRYESLAAATRAVERAITPPDETPGLRVVPRHS